MLTKALDKQSRAQTENSLFLPFPYLLEKGLTSNVMAGDLAFTPQFLLHHYLKRERSSLFKVGKIMEKFPKKIDKHKSEILVSYLELFSCHSDSLCDSIRLFEGNRTEICLRNKNTPKMTII